MERSPVSSSSIESVGYDPNSSTLEIEFKKGGIYQYHDVPSHTYEEFISSDSLGTYLHHNIKNIYAFSKM